MNNMTTNIPSLSATTSATTTAASTTTERGVWSSLEHDKFLAALKLYPEGPWRAIAEFVGTRSARQVQTHAQKYYEKVSRRVRGLRKDRKRVARAEHRLDDDMAQLCVDSSASAALARHTRRELQVLAMHRRERQGSVDIKMDDIHLSDAVAAASGDDASSDLLRLHGDRSSEHDLHRHSHNHEQESDDSDSSLSAIGDDDLDYLLHILESSDQDEHEQLWCL